MTTVANLGRTTSRRWDAAEARPDVVVAENCAEMSKKVTTFSISLRGP